MNEQNINEINSVQLLEQNNIDDGQQKMTILGDKTNYAFSTQRKGLDASNQAV